tara:strand:+ start:1925 stop:2332 length:408 start_codon:yes stop_codon:yes gene_type:complete
MGKQVKAKKASKKKAAPKSKGLGDSIEKFTKKTGIKKIVDKVSEVTGIDCGCDERKALLNKIFPYRNTECLKDEEFNWLDSFFKSRKSSLTHEEQTKMVAIHNRVLAARRKVSSCGSCAREMINVMKQLYLEYKK